MFFERLQVEDVNGKRCQENIKINGKTMLDLYLTNDAKIIGKGQIEAKREPTNDG